jgi:lipoate-protein ligase A
VVTALAGVVTPGDFDVETYRGSVAVFHADDLLADARPRLVVCEATDPAVVLGSRQQLDVVDLDACSAAGIAVARRRSGGGVVFVEPSAMCWFDVVVAANDPRFATVAGDVGASMCWLGGHIAQALGALGVDDVATHRGPMSGGRWSSLVCFAGLGPGELVRGDLKLVGISQRRTRRGSRFQCMVHVKWSPEVLVALLAPPRPAVTELPSVAVVSRDVADALPGAVARALSEATG